MGALWLRWPSSRPTGMPSCAWGEALESEDLGVALGFRGYTVMSRAITGTTR